MLILKRQSEVSDAIAQLPKVFEHSNSKFNKVQDILQA
jgi:hypothetical protein